MHKLRAVGITGNIGIWLFHFLTDRSHVVRLPGGIREDHPVLSGVPQGTVLGPLLFLIMISDIDKDVSASKLVSFADDTRLYSGVGDVTDCDNLQLDLNAVYDWASPNNMLSDPITFSDRRGRTCIVCHSGAGRLGTLKYNNFRWRSIRMFNRLPKAIRMWSSCSVVGFKSQFDSYLRNIVDLPCRSGFNNSLDGWNCLRGGHYTDDLAPN